MDWNMAVEGRMHLGLIEACVFGRVFVHSTVSQFMPALRVRNITVLTAASSMPLYQSQHTRNNTTSLMILPPEPLATTCLAVARLACGQIVLTVWSTYTV